MSGAAASLDLKGFVRDIADFPKRGVGFKDITPLLGDPKAFAAAIDALAGRYAKAKITRVAGIESRGFIIASALAYRLGAGLIPIRKKGKLPHKTHSAEYALEYGTDCLEIHVDAAKAGDNVLVVDDVIATGGTAKASCELIEKVGAKVAGLCFLIELDFLKGRAKLPGRDVFSLIHY